MLQQPPPQGQVIANVFVRAGDTCCVHNVAIVDEVFAQLEHIHKRIGANTDSVALVAGRGPYLRRGDLLVGREGVGNGCTLQLISCLRGGGDSEQGGAAGGSG